MATGSNSPNDNEGRRKPPRPGKSVDPEKSLNMAESFEVFIDEQRAMHNTLRKIATDLKNSLDMEARYTTNRRRQEEFNAARKSIADHPSDAGDTTRGVVRDSTTNNATGSPGAQGYFPGGRGFGPGMTGTSKQAMNAWTWQQQHQIMGTTPTGMSLGPSFDYFIDPSQRLTGMEGMQSMSHFQTWAAQTIGEKIAGHKRVYDPELLGGNQQAEQQMFLRPGISRLQAKREAELRKGRHREGRPVDQDTPVGVTDDESLAKGSSRRAQDTRVQDEAFSQEEVQEVREESTDSSTVGQIDTEEIRESASEQPPTPTQEVSSPASTQESPRHATPGPRHAKPEPGRHREAVPTDPNAGQVVSGDGGQGGGGGEGGTPAGGAEGEEGGAGLPPGTLTAAGVAARSGAGQNFISMARTRIGSAVAQSGGTAMGLTAALRRMPGIGLAIEGTQKGKEIYQEQREQGREYQSMVGGSNIEGWVDKRREDMYRWENYFKFSGERAREQFQTVTAAGYNDRGSSAGIMNESREGALQFMDRTYHNTGMDTQESGKVLDAAARNTHANLNELSSALERLSETAGETGINAEKARENFVGLFESFTSMGFGSNATQGASILAQTQTQYGKQFENVDMSGHISPQAQIMVGAQTGMGYGEVQGMLRNDPIAYGQARSGTLREIFLSIDPELAQAAEQAAQGHDLNNEQEVNSIYEELVGSGAPFEDHDLNTKAAAFSAMSGSQVNPEQYVIQMIHEMGGNGMAQAAVEEEEHQNALRGGSAGDVAAGGGSPAINEQQGYSGGEGPAAGAPFNRESPLQGTTDEEASGLLNEWYSEDYTGEEETEGNASVSPNIPQNKKEEYETASAQQISEWGHEGGSAIGNFFRDTTRGLTDVSQMTDQYMTGASEQYFTKWTQEGKSDPFIESLLQNTKDHENAKVKVPIAGGGERVVSLEEAVQHYSAQLASGEVEFMEGEGLEGKTTADVAGMEGTGELTDAGDERTTNDALDEQGVGQSMEQWSRDNPDKIREREEATGEGEAGEASRTIIELTPEAQRIFQIQSGESDPSAAEGMPPDVAGGQQNNRGGVNFPNRN